MKSKDISSAIKELYIELDRLSEIYEELMDTDVREAISITLNYYFVWGNVQERFPISYGMFSSEGNQSIANAIKHFLSCVSSSSELNEISVGQARLDMLQNPEITTPSGCQYEDFIGYVDELLPSFELPDYFFEESYDD